MPIVHCPECRQAARVPDSDRAMNVNCPHCRHRYHLPATLDVPEVVEDDVPVARLAPASTGSPFDFEGQQGGGGAVVSSQTERLQKMRAGAAGGWLLLAGILDSVPIFVAAFYAALVTIEPRATPEAAGVGAIAAIVFCVLALLLTVPILIGSKAMSGGWSYGMSLTGAIFALLLGVLYGLFVFPAGLLLLARQPGVALVALGTSIIGLTSCIAGIRTFLALMSASTRERFDRRDEQHERPARRRYEDPEERRSAPRRRDRDEEY